MMQGIRQWLLGVILTAFAGSLARQLVPQGRERGLVGMVCGLLMILSILRPLARLEWTDMDLPLDRLEREGTEADLRQDWQDALSAVIAEKTEAYIWDKAGQLGLQYTIHVATAAGENGIPLPDTVTIYGSYSGALAACIEEEVGVPPEKQIWLEDETWTTENEKSP